METLVQLRQKRHDLAMKARKLLEDARKENRTLSAEDNAAFDRAMADVDKLGDDIEKEERAEAAYQKLLKLDADADKSAGRVADADKPGKRTKKLSDAEREQRCRTDANFRRSRKEYKAAFRSYLLGGFRGMSQADFRALQVDADVAGGYLVPPVEFVNELIRFVKDQVFVRQLATVKTVSAAQSLGAPSLDADPADADWTAEIKTGSEDSTMAFGKRDLSPYPLAKRIKVSNKLLRLATSVEGEVLDRLGYKFAVTEEKAFLSGNAAGQPLGLFTASALGISTARDVSTGNTTTAITADGLIEAKYKLKAAYQNSPSCVWLFHRDAVKQVRKLKDANGQYLWRPGIGDDKGDRILDKAFYMSEYVPNTFTTGLYVGLIGDLRFYWIADALQMSVQRLDELYAETNQTGFIARRELDGMPVLEEAFARVKLA